MFMCVRVCACVWVCVGVCVRVSVCARARALCLIAFVLAHLCFVQTSGAVDTSCGPP